MSIKQLDKDVAHLIRAAVVFTNPAEVIDSLIANSIAGNPAEILVKFNPESFSIEVSDTGCGIEFEDLTYLGEDGVSQRI